MGTIQGPGGAFLPPPIPFIAFSVFTGLSHVLPPRQQPGTVHPLLIFPARV